MARKAQEIVIANQPRPEDHRHLRKSNEAIGLRVTEGKLTLLNRKLLNVLIYHAQQAKGLGENAPIDTAAAKKYFWIPLSVLARDAHYDSKDTKFLKEQLEEMQDIKLLLENDKQWTSERLIAGVTLANPKGLRSGTGQVWVGFSFPPEVHESVMAPSTYTKLSLLYQGVLRSNSALALYEICRRYATNPTKVTSIESFEYWYGALTGNPVLSNEDLTPYKYFKRDVLKPAMAEINTLTDIEVKLIEHKNGRRVERLQFHIEFAKQPQLNLSPAVIDMELMAQVMNLGLNQDDASNVMGMYDEMRIREALSFVNARLNQPGQSPIDSPAAYFQWTLQKGSGAVSAHQAKIGRGKINTQVDAPDVPTVMEMVRTARAKEALELYRELDLSMRAEIYERFKAAHVDLKSQGTKSKIVPFEKALDHGVTRTLLSMWYAQDQWGDLKPEDVADYVQKLNLIQQLPSRLKTRRAKGE
jgi:hypothetical protein